MRKKEWIQKYTAAHSREMDFQNRYNEIFEDLRKARKQLSGVDSQLSDQIDAYNSVCETLHNVRAQRDAAKGDLEELRHKIIQSLRNTA